MSNLNSVVSVKIVGSGLKRDQRPRLFGFADDLEFLRRFAALKFHRINFFISRDLDPEPIGQRVDAFAPTPCKPPEYL